MSPIKNFRRLILAKIVITIARPTNPARTTFYGEPSILLESEVGPYTKSFNRLPSTDIPDDPEDISSQQKCQNFLKRGWWAKKMETYQQGQLCVKNTRCLQSIWNYESKCENKLYSPVDARKCFANKRIRILGDSRSRQLSLSICNYIQNETIWLDNALHDYERQCEYDSVDFSRIWMPDLKSLVRPLRQDFKTGKSKNTFYVIGSHMLHSIVRFDTSDYRSVKDLPNWRKGFVSLVTKIYKTILLPIAKKSKTTKILWLGTEYQQSKNIWDLEQNTVLRNIWMQSTNRLIEKLFTNGPPNLMYMSANLNNVISTKSGEDEGRLLLADYAHKNYRREETSLGIQTWLDRNYVLNYLCNDQFSNQDLCCG